MNKVCLHPSQLFRVRGSPTSRQSEGSVPGSGACSLSSEPQRDTKLQLLVHRQLRGSGKNGGDVPLWLVIPCGSRTGTSPSTGHMHYSECKAFILTA